ARAIRRRTRPPGARGLALAQRPERTRARRPGGRRRRVLRTAAHGRRSRSRRAGARRPADRRRGGGSVSAALVAVVAITLLSSGLEHLRGRSAALSETLAGHRVLPATWTSPVAAVLTVLEVALGLALLVGLSRGTAATGMLALVASALFAAMTGYVHLAARRAERGAPVPCGCGLGEAPLGLWVTVRAGL